MKDNTPGPRKGRGFLLTAAFQPYGPGIGMTSITSTDSPGKMAKCG